MFRMTLKKLVVLSLDVWAEGWRDMIARDLLQSILHT